MARTFRRRTFRPRARRPTERSIRAGQLVLNTALTTFNAFVYTAAAPLTLTRFKLDIGIAGASGDVANDGVLPVLYALVTVPEGYGNNNLNYPALTGDLYNPTASVLISGVLTDGTIEDHKSSSYSRKFKTGDRLLLLMRSPNNTVPINIAVSFELSFTAIH